MNCFERFALADRSASSVTMRPDELFPDRTSKRVSRIFGKDFTPLGMGPGFTDFLRQRLLVNADLFGLVCGLQRGQGSFDRLAQIDIQMQAILKFLKAGGVFGGSGI